MKLLFNYQFWKGNMFRECIFVLIVLKRRQHYEKIFTPTEVFMLLYTGIKEQK